MASLQLKMDLAKLSEIFKTEASYRIKQVKRAIFKDLISDWSQAKWLPKELRQKLNQEVSLKINCQNFYSKDESTIKSLITLEDGLKVESVLMRHDNRNTVCVSSQVGCPLGCLFCSTGKMGFKRNLGYWEIVEQVVNFERLLKGDSPSRCLPASNAGAPPPGRCASTSGHLEGGAKRLLPGERGEKVTNIVFMGMGEPFLNYENVLGAIKVINDPEGLGIGARHISISTVGIIEGIKKLAKEKLQVNLAISLHAPNNKLRLKLIPINNKYTIEKIMDAVADYIQRTNRKVMFEYLMIKDLNDKENLAYELAALLKKIKKPLVMVNLIKYNPAPDGAGYNLTGDFKPSTTEKIQKFKRILIKEGIFVTERYRFGQDIKAACGQLASRT